VSKHGGCDNAYTEWEHTTFSLSIPQYAIWPALDRLIQFFIAPLLLPDSIERELNSIESEFQLQQTNDHTRWQQLLCALADPQTSPFAKFAWGNLRSLWAWPHQQGIDPYTELKQFYDAHYYASNMRLVLQTAYSLDEMERRIVALCSAIPAGPRRVAPAVLPIELAHRHDWKLGVESYRSTIRHLNSHGALPPPYLLNEVTSWGKLYYNISARPERHRLVVSWEIADAAWLDSEWRTKPLDFVAHLLGHEGRGSLLSFWKSKGWATSCSVDVGDDGSESSSCHRILSVSVTLSQDGTNAKNWKQIINSIYQYLGMLRSFYDSHPGDEDESDGAGCKVKHHWPT
jgi:nardilysin